MTKTELKGVSIQPVLKLVDKHIAQFTRELEGVVAKLINETDMQKELKPDAAICLFNKGVYILGEVAIRVAYKNDRDILKNEIGRMH